jgi:hypothetical protein
MKRDDLNCHGAKPTFASFHAHAGRTPADEPERPTRSGVSFGYISGASAAGLSVVVLHGGLNEREE